MAPKKKELLRALPSVSTLLEREEVAEWLTGLPRASVLAAVQSAVDDAREAILSGRLTSAPQLDDLLADAEEALLERSLPSLRGVINATGIVLHTGLGRAPLADAAVEAVAEVAAGYCNLEFDLDAGRRGKRTAHVANLLVSITGAEAATVVNNNAAATLLILKTFAEGREVIVSRGQLIEIGGSFRLPDIMRASGATLKEVGTTNRTRIGDYERAVTEDTAMLFRAHPSNYRIVGFTEEASIEQLVTLARANHLIAVDDLGSGVLFDPVAHGLPDEPSVRASLAAGADLVCFSGDKLLGGPQAGIILGRRDLVEAIEQSPLMRTYRVDKMTLAALEATLRCYLDEDEAMRAVPTLSMLTATTEQLAALANTLAEDLKKALPEEEFFVCSDVAYAGGGSMPGRELPTVVVQWRPSSASVGEMSAILRDGETPVVARIRDDAICFDLRTIREDDIEALVASVSAASMDEEQGDNEPEA